MTMSHWRPQRLEEYIGQPDIKHELRDEITVCRADNVPLENRVYHSAPGLGKTTLVAATAAEAEVPIHFATGKEITLESVSRLLASLDATGFHGGTTRSNPKAGTVQDPSRVRHSVICLDEVEEAPRNVLQALHEVLEPRVDWSKPMIFHGMDRGRPADFWIPSVRWVFLTNYLGRLIQRDVAILSRFSHPIELQPYTTDEMVQIIEQYARHTDHRIDSESAHLIAERSQGTPRTATQLVREVYKSFRARQIRGETGSPHATTEDVEATLRKKRIDEHGLDETGRNYLRVLADTGPKVKMGVQTIADQMSVDVGTVEVAIEPWIRRQGLAEKGSGGRWITDKGRQAIGMTPHNPISLRQAG